MVASFDCMVPEMREKFLPSSGWHGLSRLEEGKDLKLFVYWKDNKVERFGLCSLARGSSASKALERAYRKRGTG
jgi:hypothetical protein